MGTEPCSCAPLYVGLNATGTLNWNPECPQHGEGTSWWQRTQEHARKLSDANGRRPSDG